MRPSTKSPQEKAASRIVREHHGGSAISVRQLPLDGDLLVFVHVRKPSYRLHVYRVHADGSYGTPFTYATRKSAGFKIVAPSNSFPEPRTALHIAARLPRFADLATAVRFLADWPVIPTADRFGIAHVVDEQVGRMSGLGPVVETSTYSFFTRDGEVITKEKT